MNGNMEWYKKKVGNFLFYEQLSGGIYEEYDSYYRLFDRRNKCYFYYSR